jgi:glycerophosphoryl diester phosphodiesterase
MIHFTKIAQRGSSGSYPENTRIAFERAIEAGVDMLALDCRISKDGHVVILRDEGLSHFKGGTGTVQGKTIRQLKKLDAGIGFRKQFKDQRILTLEEVMEIATRRVELNLDIKPARRGPLGIEIRILFVLSHYDYLGRTIVSSADYRALRRVRELAPEARIGVVYRVGVREDPFQAARELAAESLHVEKDFMTPEVVERSSTASPANLCLDGQRSG